MTHGQHAPYTMKVQKTNTTNLGEVVFPSIHSQITPTKLGSSARITKDSKANNTEDTWGNNRVDRAETDVLTVTKSESLRHPIKRRSMVRNMSSNNDTSNLGTTGVTQL